MSSDSDCFDTAASVSEAAASAFLGTGSSGALERCPVELIGGDGARPPELRDVPGRRLGSDVRFPRGGWRNGEVVGGSAGFAGGPRAGPKAEGTRGEYVGPGGSDSDGSTFSGAKVGELV